MIQIILFLTLFCLSLRGSNSPSDICNSKSCTSIAKQISELMDQETDPCVDFNKFACGGFEKSSILNGQLDYLKWLIYMFYHYETVSAP